MLKLIFAAAVAAAIVCGRAEARDAASARVADAEAVYADLNDASSILDAIDSGLFTEYRGKDRAAWQTDFHALRDRLGKALSGLSPQYLPQGERQVLDILQSRLAGFADAGPSVAPDKSRCADGKRKELAREALGEALDACFTEIANNLEFEGTRIDRVSALGKLGVLPDTQQRQTLFLSLSPLWTAINGANQPDSPYRRLIAMTADEARQKESKGSPVDAAARTLGVTVGQVEQWLVRILEAWGSATEGTSLEPWDYRYASGAADRALAGKVPLESMLAIDHRYYRDLGADLDGLGVRYDLKPRPEKSSVAYADFLVHGRSTSAGWQPTIARVSATYRDGGLGALNELVHENGHALHISAIRNRPAYVDWNDDLFVEAFADVPSWSLYEPAWQRHYLGSEASEQDSLRALLAGVMLDVAWSLFETRMLSAPTSDPNAVWTEITHRYLHIVPHPELSWWAVRGQLVEAPGYMVNYGLGAVLTADLRQRVRERIGPFDTGNPRWYPFLSENLLRFGSELDTPQLLARFLGRPVSAEALLAQIRRIEKAQTR